VPEVHNEHVDVQQTTLDVAGRIERPNRRYASATHAAQHTALDPPARGA
jgi:hypothetical protein